MRVWIREGIIGPDHACVWIELEDDRMLVIREDGSHEVFNNVATFNLPGIPPIEDPIIDRYIAPREGIVLLEESE